MARRKRVKLEVEIDLDPVPGEFHTDKSARDAIRIVLYHRFGHYNPTVDIKPSPVRKVK